MPPTVRDPLSTHSYSVLFPHPVPASAEAVEPPSHFHDLNLDQVVDAITKNWKDYDLTSYFFAALTDLDAIDYRQEVMQELDQETLAQHIEAFASRMRAMRSQLGMAKQVDYAHERERWVLGAIHAYCDALVSLSDSLRALELRSRGMRAFRAYLAVYVDGPSFRALLTETKKLLDDLSSIRYCLLIKDNSITVLPYDNETDYSAVVELTFDKFRRGAAKDYRTRITDAGRLDHVEAQVLERVAWLHPAIFEALQAFCAQHVDYLDETIARFDREVQFYIAYLRFIDRLRRRGLPFCYPQLSNTSKEVRSCQAFDLALASKLLSENTVVVRNDFFLRGSERIFVVSGPNQGGKTTFARMFGQLHHLAALGCPVPGTEARLFLCDHLLVHFERAENIASQRGKLQDDLIRVREMLDQATPNSIIIMNEPFASTTLKDAIYLSKKVMAEIVRMDLLAVCVTFLDDLASFDAKTVSIVSTVDANDPTVRTFKLERRPADGLAYALAIAEKYRVTYDWLKQRIRP